MLIIQRPAGEGATAGATAFTIASSVRSSMAHSRTSRRITGLAALGAAAVIGLTGACSPGQSAGTVAARAAAPAAAAGSPIDMTSGFYVDPDSNPATWVRNNPGDARAAQIKSAIADKPTAGWFGDWSGDIGT